MKRLRAYVVPRVETALRSRSYATLIPLMLIAPKVVTGALVVREFKRWRKGEHRWWQVTWRIAVLGVVCALAHLVAPGAVILVAIIYKAFE